MLTSQQLIAKYGNPEVDLKTFEANWMIEHTLPDEVHSAIPVLPKVIYLNKDIADRTDATLRALISAGVHTEIKTFDGWFNVRNQRASTSVSSHAFGISVDLNTAWNPFKIRGSETDAQWEVVRSQIVKWSPEFLQVWRDNEWFLGADWHHRIDGMHFEGF